MKNVCYRCGCSGENAPLKKHILAGRAKSVVTWLCFDCFHAVQDELTWFAYGNPRPDKPAVFLRPANADEVK